MAHNKTLITSVALAAALALLTSTARLAYGQEKEDDEKSEKASAQEWPPSKPVIKVTPIQAMAVARKKLGGGTPFQANFEFDEGHWVYGVMIVKGHAISEVEVDPMTGKALATESVTPDDEAKESTEMLKKVAAAGG